MQCDWTVCYTTQHVIVERRESKVTLLFLRILIEVILIALIFTIENTVISKMSSSQPSAFADALANFSLNLYRQIGSTAGADSNIFISPLSISFALSMTYAGAAGNTKSQMKDVLYGKSIGKEDDEVHSLFAEVMGILNKENVPYKLHLANRVYGHEPLLGKLLEQFSTTVQKKYGSELQALDFGKDNGNHARGVINKWVGEKTNDKIKDLIPEGVLSAMTAMVLVNAIYFKGNWLTQFDAKKTTPAPFYASPNKEMQVQMMHLRKHKFNYTENQKFQLLGMPYSGKDLVMFVWLPKEKFGLSELEKKMTPKELMDSILEAESESTLEHVAIPKFKLEESVSLADALKVMGARDMFDQGKADFSKINGHGDLYVSAVLHKAFIDVNEEGTEAAAATAIAVNYRCAMPHPDPIFVADHPFLFAIVDKRTTSILFLGRYNGK